MKTGEHAFDLDGVQYTIRMGWAAMRRYEQVMGESAVEALKAVESIEGGQMFGERIVALFHCAISPRPDDMDATAELMDDLGSVKSMELLMKSLDDGFAGMKPAAPASGEGSATKNRKARRAASSKTG
jgi:hypothetical protein